MTYGDARHPSLEDTAAGKTGIEKGDLL